MTTSPNYIVDQLVELAIAAWNAGGSKRPRAWLYAHGGLLPTGVMDKRYKALVHQARAATAPKCKPDTDAGAVFPGQFIHPIRGNAS